MPQTTTLDHLRRFAVARSLFTPTTLLRAITQLGFVQADPLRAPARAQDLTLRHRVKGYQAGDLDRYYPDLPIEEDFFVNYGFMPRAINALMHPREPRTVWTPARWAQAHQVLAFVQARAVAHPRAVDEHFAHGKVKNWFGGSSNASTQLLDGMHYRGLVRTAKREGGVRLYAARPVHEAAVDADAAYDALVDVAVNKYAPLPELSLNMLVSRVRYGAPQWTHQVRDAVRRTKLRLPSVTVDGQRWFWPESESPVSRRHTVPDAVRLLAPFDPVVWDRRRFEFFWGWPYRFEAYTPAAKRLRGHYALPLLWRDQVIGWCNLSVASGRLVHDIGFVADRAPRDAAFKLALEEELARMATFLAL